MKNLRPASILSAALLLVAGGCAMSTNTGGEAPTTGRPTSGGAGETTAGGGTGTGTGTGAMTGDFGGTGSAGTGSGSGSAGTGSGSAGAASSAPVLGAGGATGTSPPSVTTPPPVNTQNQLTAGTWDDNLNFDFYAKYLAAMDAAQLEGLPLIPRAGRLEITVVDGAGAPLPGASVTVSDAAGKLFAAPTRGDGKLFFFPATVGATSGTALTIAAAAGQASASVAAHVGDAKADLAITATRALPVPTLDLALVVDTTGSMGDELEYLKVEMSAIVTRVAHDFPNVSQRWSAIFYRDTVDEYVVRVFDFTGSVDTLTAEIAAQSASGGGDIPEAPDQALARLTKLSWRPDSVARMAFWVADAPHHAAQALEMSDDILAAHGLGIRLYPISASGTDDLLEYTMREAAEVTGGRYLFLTNDSGIGNGHKEPTIPCYVVTTLDKAMTRMIDMELTGTDSQPAAGDIIRTSGNPQNGTCKLADDQIVTAL